MFLEAEWSWMTTGLGSSWPKERCGAKEKERERALGVWPGCCQMSRIPGWEH